MYFYAFRKVNRLGNSSAFHVLKYLLKTLEFTKEEQYENLIKIDKNIIKEMLQLDGLAKIVKTFAAKRW